MKIRMRVSVPGRFYSVYEDLKRGDVVEIDDLGALDCIAQGRAEAELEGEIGPPYVPPPPEVMAELRARVLPPKRPLDSLRQRTKGREAAQKERLEEAWGEMIALSSRVPAVGRPASPAPAGCFRPNNDAIAERLGVGLVPTGKVTVPHPFSAHSVDKRDYPPFRRNYEPCRAATTSVLHQRPQLPAAVPASR